VKNYILDTNVILHDPNSVLHFQENSVLLPIEVIEEIDRFKRESTERGANARAISRLLDSLRSRGHLSDGVTLESGGQLRIIFTKETLKGAARSTLNVDDRILQLALQIKKSKPRQPTILVTKDINLRLKADALGLHAEDYETDHIRPQDLYSGSFEIVLDPNQIAEFRKQNHFPIPPTQKTRPREYCTITDSTNPKRTALAKVDATGTRLVPILEAKEGIWGVHPRNREQRFAFDALLDDQIKLITLMGKAGTGKTLIAMAAGLLRTVVHREFRRLVIARPTISVGKELGFLPGTLEEKLTPWMQPIQDALDMLNDLNMGHDQRRVPDLVRSGTIVLEPLSYIRGRSIANQFMVIDEAQNLTPLEVKTIITRVGHGTTIVFTGDPYQIDNPYVDFSSNGFTYLVTRFREEALSAHVELQKGERSDLAELAANLL
jgi:PhoH-like ATPase